MIRINPRTFGRVSTRERFGGTLDTSKKLKRSNARLEQKINREWIEPRLRQTLPYSVAIYHIYTAVYVGRCTDKSTTAAVCLKTKKKQAPNRNENGS